ncbi:MAG: DUF2059 domain-containing protein [Sphingopyxis sp.]|nr:DUF2059 domain-containing protein [Sphingopyxis sp.]
MKIWQSAVALALLLGPLPAAAQDGTGGNSSESEARDTPAPSAERLAIARQVIDLMMPQSEMAAQAESYARPMMDNLISAIEQNEELKTAFREMPRLRPIFNRFVDRVRSDALSQLTESMPGLREVMISAYARRFDEQQLRDIGGFFATPSGRAYSQQSALIMSDPEVAAWQRQSFTESQERLQPLLEQFMAEIAEAAAKTDAN